MTECVSPVVAMEQRSISPLLLQRGQLQSDLGSVEGGGTQFSSTSGIILWQNLQ
jgi:hypothetical protein